MGSNPHKGITTLVEVWSGGDDGLTQRLKNSIERKFKVSDEFQLSSGKQPKTLIVTIPSNVLWRRSGNRTRVLYDINFTSANGEALGSSKGSCFDDDLPKCAAQVFSDAVVAAQKVQ